MTARTARQERNAEHQTQREQDRRQTFATLSALEAELRLNKSLAEVTGHQTLFKAWVPFELEVFNSARSILVVLPLGTYSQLIKAEAILSEYVAFSKLPTPPAGGSELENFRGSGYEFAIEPLTEAIDGLAKYLRESCQE